MTITVPAFLDTVRDGTETTLKLHPGIASCLPIGSRDGIMNERNYDAELIALDAAIRRARQRAEFDPESVAARGELQALAAQRRRIADERARSLPANRDGIRPR